MSYPIKTYRRIPTIVKARRLEGNGRLETSNGWLPYNDGDYLVEANDKKWVCEGDVFFLLYERVFDVNA